ncbi:hypothetical protein [Pontiella sulfatireligans]|uniref:Uncharacterized protein n=1 Tax=Pontiella sulfatireligans TaxID=2750658 RepID=A0A6C2ULM9_9BACT|nr:hypothetical protein [Pontiella sulfatireligans]VGO20813.1 hypothetical protein SCARR_02880 [Pontiella sulfatireligans]
MSRNLGWIGGVFLLFCVSVPAQLVTQDITLDKGWNAVYLYVQPTNSSCDAVCTGWPVDFVSLYNQERAAVQYVSDPDETVDTAEDFFTWRPGHPSGGNSLSSLIGGHSYLIYATTSFSTSLSGNAVVPRIQWLPKGESERVNLVGFCVQPADAFFGDYLSGAGFENLSIYTVGGTNSSATLTQLGGFTGSTSSEEITRGQAYFISCDKVSSYCGPLRVSPAGSGGLFFASTDSYATASLKNESGDELDVTVEIMDTTAQSVVDLLKVYDVSDGWVSYAGAMDRTLAADESWNLRLAIDRTQMSSNSTYGAVVRCSDSCGGEVSLSLQADYGEPSTTNALWPSGLWVGTALFNKVSQITTNNVIVDGLAAAGVMEYRLIVHVDANNESRLLQRAIIATVTNTNGTDVTRIYTDEDDLPSDAQIITRISSVAFGIENDIARDDSVSGEFGQLEGFSYVVAHDDRSNPFYHSRHPRHDGLKNDFKTPLRSGDDLDNYNSSIKPETFSISNRVTLVFAQSADTEGSALWAPEETVSGAIVHEIDNLRKEGTLKAEGAFAIRRVCKVSELEE